MASGYTGLKTNIVLLDGDNPRGHVAGLRARRGLPGAERRPQRLDAIKEQLAAFREGTGPDMDILVDLNFNYKTEGYLKMARAMEQFDLFWLEIDTRDPEALRYIREGTTIPIASCEMPVRSPRVPPVLRERLDGHGDHRRAVQRHPGVDEDRVRWRTPTR